ncbi:MAG TPA: ABC transporter permease, partial [Gemmatimonadaceae bacterium]
MDTIVQDLRYAFRTLAKRPGFTVVAVLTLMLGIGANTAIFSVVNAVLLRPLPYPATDRLAVLWGSNAQQQQLLFSVPDFEEWRARNHSFDDMGIERTQSVNLTGIDKPDRLIGDFVDSHTLRILGARTAMGRLFTDPETMIGAGQQVALISHAVWASRFGSDPHMLGRTLTLNGRPFVVVGVLAADFQDPYSGVEVYLPITSPPNPRWLTRDNPNVWAIGRMKPGVTTTEAQRDVSAIAADLARAYPQTNAGMTAVVQPLRDSLVGNVRPFLLIVLGAVAFVLLIACANVANLLLARAAARQREMSLRAALGAGRSRLVRQLLTESVTLSVIGGVAGVLAARWGIVALVVAVPGGLPAYGAMGINSHVLMFSMAITLGAGLMFGAAPAVFAARANLNDALTTRSADTTTGGRGWFHLRSAFVT